MFEKRKDATSDARVEPASVERRPTPKPTQPAARSTSLIGASIRINGNIEGDDNLVVEGRVEGLITLSMSDLTVGGSGQVVANVSAKTVKMDGSVTGDIHGSELVTVSSSGRLQGNITAPRVTLEDGAQFKGSIDMDPNGALRSTADRSHQAPATPSAEDHLVRKASG